MYPFESIFEKEQGEIEVCVLPDTLVEWGLGCYVWRAVSEDCIFDGGEYGGGNCERKMKEERVDWNQTACKDSEGDLYLKQAALQWCRCRRA